LLAANANEVLASTSAKAVMAFTGTLPDFPKWGKRDRRPRGAR
jgi:hypothetical protein